ncbi:MAG: hypothetical protein WB610_18480 [Rhodomicrobium sp.]
MMVVFIHLQGAPRKHPAYRQWLKTRSPSDNGGRADNQRHPARPVFIRDFGTELGGNARVIKPDFLLDDAVVPNGMKIEFEDGATPPDLVRGSARLVPGARFEEIAGSGHLPCIDQPLKIVSLIAQHLLEAGYV